MFRDQNQLTLLKLPGISFRQKGEIYCMTDAQLPLDILHWLIAIAPIAVLLVLLVAFHWRGIEAGPAGLIVAGLIALLVFQTPFRTLAVAAGKGIWDAVFILYVVWTALLLYLVTLRAGAFDALRRGFLEFSRNELFLVLAIGWVFSTFFQGVAGFGAPIAVTAPLLIGIGVRPVYAVLIPLIAHTWAKMFGTLAVGWLAMLRVAEVADPLATSVQTAILLAIVNLLGGLAVTWMYGRMPAILHGLPLILIIAVIQGGGQWAMMYINPVLSTFIAGTLALMALYPLSRWKRYAEPAEGITERPAMRDEPLEGGAAQTEEAGPKTEMGLGLALFPYIFLTVIAILASGVPPITEVLRQFQIGLPFPAVETGYGITIPAAAPYSPFSPLTHPGTFVLITSLIALVVYRSRGYYDPSRHQGPSLIKNLVRDSVPSSIAIASFLTMSKLMDHSGQVTVLALGIASVATVPVYAFAANWIGILGGFMTSSSTASNILFSPLQVQAAEALPGLSQSSVLAAQGAGGTIGNVIAPANIVIGTGAARIAGEEGTILRKALPWTILAGVVTGIATIILNYL
jgi:lactate permease